MNRPFTVTARPLRDKNGPRETFTVHARTAAQARLAFLHARTAAQARLAFLRARPELKVVSVRRAGAAS